MKLIQGYTWIDGKRYLVVAGKDTGKIVRLGLCKTDYWPLQDYRVYPDSHIFLTPGVWDFTEDKQRARAILQNYTLDAAKFDVLPEWLFDKNKIKNKQQLKEHKAGKFIEGENIDGNSIVPLQKAELERGGVGGADHPPVLIRHHAGVRDERPEGPGHARDPSRASCSSRSAQLPRLPRCQPASTAATP